MFNFQRRNKLAKILLTFLTAAILFSCVTGTAFADGKPKISGANIKCNAGDTVEFSVSVSDNPGIAAYFVYLTSENNNITFGDTARRGSFCSSGTILANTHGSNGVKVSWFDLSNAEKSGVLFSIDVVVSKNTPDGTYPITVKISGENTIDENGNEVAFEAVNGSITVKGGKATVLPTDNEPADGQKNDGKPASADKNTDNGGDTKQNAVKDKDTKQPGTATGAKQTGKSGSDKQTDTATDTKQTDKGGSDKQADTATDVKQTDKNESGAQPEEDGDSYGDTVINSDTAKIAKDDSVDESGVYEVELADSEHNSSTGIIAACAIGIAAIAVLLIVRKKSKK